jgi:hypothetical protein
MDAGSAAEAVAVATEPEGQGSTFRIRGGNGVSWNGEGREYRTTHLFSKEGVNIRIPGFPLFFCPSLFLPEFIFPAPCFLPGDAY